MAHQIDESKPKYLSQTRFMSGRRIIKTSVTEITDENVVDVLRKALATHAVAHYAMAQQEGGGKHGCYLCGTHCQG